MSLRDVFPAEKPMNMLYLLDRGAAMSNAPARDVASLLPVSPHKGFLARLFVRRWLVGLATCLIFALSAFYGVPWYSEALAIAAFTLGAAVIPRSINFPAVTSAPLISPAGTAADAMAKTLIDALPEPAIVLARDGTIHSFNGRAQDLFGGLKQGGHISSAIRNPQVLGAVIDCAAGQRLQTVTFAERVPVERQMAATISLLGAPAAGSDVPAILLFLRDLTEQRRVDQLRSDFIANASHEIKTPLASLVGFIATLQGPARNDEKARDQFLAIMAKQAERMSRLIDNLMSLSRVEMRAHLKPQNPVKIVDLVQQACDALEPMASEAEIAVTVETQLNGALVLGDRDELTQVFLNLVHNAIKYGKPGGRVDVKINRLENGPPAICITVADNGPGIATQHLPRLTERFTGFPTRPRWKKAEPALALQS